MGIEKAVRAKRSDPRSAARKALLSLLDPLAGFALDCGLSSQELNVLLRTAIVRQAAERQLKKAERVNVSGIAASTGVPRAEVARILHRKTSDIANGPDHREQSTNRILSGWHDDPQFTDSAGRPAVLPIFGQGSTFETLAKAYGSGLPLRSLLDELLGIGAINLIDSRTVRAKKPRAIFRRFDSRAIKEFGDLGHEILATMLEHLRNPKYQGLVTTIQNVKIETNVLPHFRNELAKRTSLYLSGLRNDSSGASSESSESEKKPSSQVNIRLTVFYSEMRRNMTHRRALARKNLSRNAK